MNNPSDQEKKTSLDGKEKDDKVNNNSNSNDINKEKEEIKEHLLKILYLAINSDDVNPNMKDSVFKVVSSELCKLNESSSNKNNYINSDNIHKSSNSRTIDAPSNNYQELNNPNSLSYPNNNLNNSSSSNTNVNLNLSTLSFIVPPNVYNPTGLINDPNIYLRNIHNQNNPSNHINPRNIGIDNFDRLLYNHNNQNYSGINNNFNNLNNLNNINNINYLNNSNFHGYNPYPNILPLLNLNNPNNINIYNPYNYMSNSNYNNINNILLNLTGNKDNDANNNIIKKEIEKLGFSNNINNINNINSNNSFGNRNICNEFVDEAKYLNQYKASSDLYNIMSLYNNDQNNDNDNKENNNAFEKWLIENPNYFYNINNTNNNLSQFDNNKSIGINSNNNLSNANQQSFYSDLLFKVNNNNNNNNNNLTSTNNSKVNNNTVSSNKQNDLLEYYSNNLQNNINNSIKLSSNNNINKVPNKTGISNTNNNTDTNNYGNNQFQEQLYNYLNFKTQFPVKSDSNYDNMNITDNRNESCFDKNLIESMYSNQINNGNKAQLNKKNNNSNSNNNINNLNNINSKKLNQQKSAKYLLDKMTNNNFSDVVDLHSIYKNNSKQDIMKNHTKNANNNKNNGEQDTSIFNNNNNNNNNTIINKKDTSTSKTKQVAIKETFDADRPELIPLNTKIPNNVLNYILEIFEFSANYDLVDNKKINNLEEFYSDFITNSKDYFKKVVVYFLTNLTYFNSKNNAYTASINNKISEKIHNKNKNLCKQYDFFVNIGNQFVKSIITNEKLIANLIFFIIKMSMSSGYCSGNCILEREDLADIIEVIYSKETELFDIILLESFSNRDNKDTDDNKSNLTSTFKTKLMYVLMYVLMELPGFKLLINEKQGTFNQEKEKYQLENEITHINKKLNFTKAKISDIQVIFKNSNNSNNNITTSNNTIVFNQMKLSNLEKEEEEFTKNFDLLIKRYNKTFTSNTRRVLIGKDYLKNVYYLPHNFLSERIILIKRKKTSGDTDINENGEWRILRFEDISSFSSKLSNSINSEVNLNKKLEIMKIIVEYKKRKNEEKNKSTANDNDNKETKHVENNNNDKEKDSKSEELKKDDTKEINLIAASYLDPIVASDISSLPLFNNNTIKNEIITIIESNVDSMIKNIKDSEKTITEYLENFDKLWVRHEIKEKIFALLDSNTRLFKQQVLNTIKEIINNDSNNSNNNNSITFIKHFLSNSNCCLDYVIFINNLLFLLFSRFNKPFKLISENDDDSEDDDDKKKKDNKKNKEKDNKESKDDSDDLSYIEYNNQDNLIIKLSDDLMINMFEPRIYSNFIRLWPRDLEELNCNKNLIKMFKKNYLNNVDYTVINKDSDENRDNKSRINNNVNNLIKLTEDSETADINDINEITSTHTINKTTKIIENNNTLNFDFLLFTSFTLKYLIDNLLLRWESKGKMYLKKKPKREEEKEEEDSSSSSTNNNDDEDFKTNTKSKSKINKNKDEEQENSDSDSETNSDVNSIDEENNSNNDEEAKESNDNKDDNDSNNRRLTRNQRLQKKKEKKEHKKEEKNKSDQNQQQQGFLKNKRKKSTVTSNIVNNKNYDLSNENNNITLNLVEDVYKKTRSGRRARVGKSDKNKICYICNENEIDLICDICGIGSHLSCSELKKTPSTWYCNVCSA